MSKKKSIIIKKEDKISIILLIPIMIILAMVPLIVYLKVVPNDEATKIFMGGMDNNVDFFSYYKSLWFTTLTGIGLFIYFSQILLDRNIKIKKDPIYYPMIAYGVLIVLSTIFATHKTVAIRGFMDRYEGMWVLLSYLGVMFLSYNLVNNEKQLKYILGSLGFSTLMMSIIGFTQYIGRDIFRTDFMKKLITPAVYSDQLDNINFTFELGRVYSTLYNPNYVGVYSTMIFALFSTIFLLSKEIKLKIVSVIISLLSLLSLFGSGSRAGLLALGLYFLLIVLVFRNTILKHKLLSFVSVLIITSIFVGANVYSNGSLLNRLKSGINSITSKEDSYNFKNVYNDNNLLVLDFDDYDIKLKYQNNEIEFYNENDKILDIEQNDSIIKIKEEPYNKHQFEVIMFNDTYGLRIDLVTNRNKVKFNAMFLSSGEIKVVDSLNRPVEAYKAPYIGFEGRETLASNRGYIWSRSIPMIKDSVLIGNGPDTYGLHFPNNDYYGKLIGLRLEQQVDKPHNLYLQITLNTGFFSLLSFVAIISIYLISSFRIYFKKREYLNLTDTIGLGVFFLVVIYLFTGISNDSIIAISPLFWTLLGVGYKLNQLIQRRA